MAVAEWVRFGRWWSLEHEALCEILPVIAGGAFALTQRAFRFYEDGAENSSVAIVAENTNLTRLTLTNSVIQLRIGLQESGSGSFGGATTDDFQLQYSKNAGAFTNVTNASTNVRGFNSASLTDAGTTTNRLSVGTGSFVAGEISEVGLVTDRQVTANNFTEMLYSLELVAADLANGNTLDFRLLLNGATMTYSVTPRITISKAYTLACSPGGYSMSGTAATPKVGRKLTVDPGSYAMAGIAAALKRGYPLTASPGSFVETGMASALKVGRLVSASPGAVTWSGTSAALKAGYRVAAGAGSVSWTGTAATLDFAQSSGFSLVVDPGSFAWTGVPAALMVGRRAIADPGAINWSGVNAALKVGHLFAVAPGAFVETGTAAGLRRSYLPLTAAAGSFVLSGTTAALHEGHRLNASPAAFAWAGTNATLIGPNVAYELVTGSGSFAWVGSATGLLIGRHLTADVGAAVLAGTDMTPRVTRRLSAGTGSYAWSGVDATPGYTTSTVPREFPLVGAAALTTAELTARVATQNATAIAVSASIQARALVATQER